MTNIARSVPAALGAALALAASPAAAAPVITITGHGYGHGVGMSQWGAEGLAREGASVDAILAHYYPGTVLKRQSAALRIRVLLLDAASVALVGDATTTATTSGAYAAPIPAAGSLTAAPARGGRVGLRDASGALLAVGATIRLTSASPITVAGRAYRGDIVLSRRGATVEVIDDVPLEWYVRGVVAYESPASWHAAALQAQAVAARSYALAERRPTAPFDVYPDTRSQMYGGVRAETRTTNAAVHATALKALTYNGIVAKTFFSSSSGGRTAAVEDVWGSSPIPYLPSVPDPTDVIAPQHTWAPVRLDAAALGAALGLGPVRSLALTTNPSRRVASVSFTTAAGTTTFSGGTIRSRLVLRSTWFALQLVDLRRVTARRHHRVLVLGTVAPGGRVAIDGRIGGVWHRIGAVTDVGGQVAWSGPRQGATAFRLRIGKASSGTRAAR